MPITQLVNAILCQAEQAQGPGIFEALTPWLLVIGIFYFLIIRPQQKRTKDHKMMLSALKRDDEVATSGGLIGRITGLTDTVVTIEIAPNVRVKVERSQVAGMKTKGSGNKKGK